MKLEHSNWLSQCDFEITIFFNDETGWAIQTDFKADKTSQSDFQIITFMM